MKKSSINNDDKNAVVIPEDLRLNYGLRLLITCNGEPGSFGPGVASLLHGIQKYGSLAKAAESMGMAYSKAWKVMRNMEQYFGFQFLIRQTGRGYGSVLTPKCEDFLNRYDAFLKDVNNYATYSFKSHFTEFKSQFKEKSE